MLAVGIDVSKSKSAAAILNPDGTVHTKPFEFRHSQPEMDALIRYIKDQNQPVTILMENTGHYHYPVLKALEAAGLPVCLINAYQMKKYGDMELRKAKTDKKDALRIARYALEKGYSLVPHTSMDQKYEDLRFLARQYDQRMGTLTTNKVFLINLLDETMPGITKLLSLTTRDPETSLTMLFIKRFKSYDRIKKMGRTRFLDSYNKLARKSRNRRAYGYGLAIYELAVNSITTRGENEFTLAAQDQCVDLVSESQKAADAIILKMQTLAETLPEYAVLRSMAGVGDRLGPLILAEIGDIRRFHSGKALNAYAGNDAPPYQSGTFESHNRHISKRGNAALRKYCFEVMQALKLTRPQDDPVYLFLIKKEQEGKPYNVAKMAGVNKFLRIYYARAMEALRLQ
ncbi:MAG: IS110 family transposase [Oscillospiraceae bacterium]|nr:IS110 family transposase [Oscillospiraceae bacterium]MBR2554681.1 IS110 family transposase [Aeriscardovia sp.]